MEGGGYGNDDRVENVELHNLKNKLVERPIVMCFMGVIEWRMVGSDHMRGDQVGDNSLWSVWGEINNYTSGHEDI